MGTIAKQFTICIACKLAGCGCSVSEKPPRTAEACHFDPSAGHMGEKRTIARITERLIWSGVVNDVKEMASKLLKFHLNTSLFL